MKDENKSAAKAAFEIFGNYALLERIAYGGMASVFLARPSHSNANGRLLVIKRILPHVANDADFVRMFRAEIQVCMGFNHPNIVQLFDFGQIAGQPYLAMEYIEGKNVREILSQFGNGNESVPIPVAVSIASQAAAGLHYAHTFKNPVTGEDLKTTHRDVSPQNIIVTYDGNVKVIDFGIAKAEVQSTETTRTGMIKGKISYLSPEQAALRTLDGRSDVFSLGIVLWEMLTGKRLFTLGGGDEIQLLMNIKNCDKFIQAPSKVKAGIPEELDKIVLKSLACNPADRFENALEFQKALREFLIHAFSGFGYSDVADTLKHIFKNEMKQERARIRKINAEAQIILAQQEPTTPLITEELPGFIPKFISGKEPGQTGSIEAATTQLGAWGSLSGQSQIRGSDGVPGSMVAVQLPNGSGTAFVPVSAMDLETLFRPRSGFWSFPSITRTKLLVLLLGVSLMWLAETDREHMLMEKFFLSTNFDNQVTRLIGHRSARQPSSMGAISLSKADGVTDVVAMQKVEDVLLRVEVFPKNRRIPTVIKVNGQILSAKSPQIRVPMDESILVQVKRKSYKDYEGELILKSSEADLKTKVYRLPVKLVRRKK